MLTPRNPAPRILTLSSPVRTCVGCRRRRPQSMLVRLARSQDGQILLGRSHPGRGAWLCADLDSQQATDCLEMVRKSGGFARAMRAKMNKLQTDQDWVDLRHVIDAWQSGSSRPLR